MEYFLLQGHSRSPAELLVPFLVPVSVRPAFSPPDIGRYSASVTSDEVLAPWCAQHTSKENAAPPQKLVLIAEPFPCFLTLPKI